ncbi:hypothetical protein I3760_02G115500 [Carya illinoinensis]|uniref:C2H2-type domain-containing protein n=1 Tax=Carya illinoinensis TaxID=32201 RepID=A0A8T1RDS5_CARIL|nr:transcriptional regulator SUPERMAN-like isoform X1 [Carya illinoinensis]XP_042960027.1 transcriptional regulator SUPERMAN-like isoform X1 [Carya illinoinensis]KAG2722122.1 hypothetical protein I3760_02G115500 [Carya illinoinensis]KAG6664744.1 hypothetical protein CIPAW_02G115500 [Carya illinoinensis]
MERKNSLSNSLKDGSFGTRAIKDPINNNNSVPKDSVNCGSQSYGDHYVNGFSWPPRSYTCSFCKREFKSAQALGGHMNVHRRDRARLRQSPPRDGQHPFLNLNPNPKFSSSSSSSQSSQSRRLTPFSFPLPSLISSPLSSSTLPYSASLSDGKKWGTLVAGSLFDSSIPKGMDLTNMKSEKSYRGGEEFDGFKKGDGCKIFKKPGIVRLDLEIGILSDSKEDIDLELRLGCS